MGLLRRIFEGKRIRDGARTEAVVLAINPPTSNARAYQMLVELLVRAPAGDQYEVERSVYVPAAKWPMPGTAVPVLVDRADPERVQVLWDEVPNRDKTEIQRTLDRELAAGRIRARQQTATGAPPEELHSLFDTTERSTGSGLYLVELVERPAT